MSWQVLTLFHWASLQNSLQVSLQSSSRESCRSFSDMPLHNFRKHYINGFFFSKLQFLFIWLQNFEAYCWGLKVWHVAHCFDICWTKSLVFQSCSNSIARFRRLKSLSLPGCEKLRCSFTNSFRMNNKLWFLDNHRYMFLPILEKGYLDWKLETELVW